MDPLAGIFDLVTGEPLARLSASGSCHVHVEEQLLLHRVFSCLRGHRVRGGQRSW